MVSTDGTPCGVLKVALAPAQIRLLRSAVQCLGKIGTDVLLEALPEKLILRAINSSRSAYLAITFHCNFFSAYEVFNVGIVQAAVLVKQLAATFRTVKPVQMLLELKSDASRLVVTVSAENGLRKIYKVPCLDAEILQATVDKDAFPTCLIAGAAELNRLLSNFQASLEEITIYASPESTTAGRAGKAVQIVSFVDPLKGQANKALHTQLTLDPQEIFFSYQHTLDEPSDVTFNLKDFRVMLALCEALNANCAIRFERPGSPLVVEPHQPAGHSQDMGLEAELVLATLMESAPVRTQRAPQPPTTARRAAANANRTPANVPGDTPLNAGHNGASGAALDAAAGVPRPSRFARERLQPPMQPQFPAPDLQPDSEPQPTPQPLGNGHMPSAHMHHSSGATGTDRRVAPPAAQLIAGMLEGRTPPPCSAGVQTGGRVTVQAHGTGLSGRAASGQHLRLTDQRPVPSGLQYDAPLQVQPGQREDEHDSGATWQYMNDQQPREGGDEQVAYVIGDQLDTAVPGDGELIRSRYRHVLEAEEEEDEESDAIPGTP